MKTFTRRDLFAIIWPLLVDQLLNVLIGMIDVMMVSSLGEAAISGVSLIDTLNNLMFQILFAVAAGGNVVISKHIGADENEKAGKASAQLFTVTIVMMTFISVMLLVGRRSILGLLFGAVEQEVMENALKYMFITVLSYPAMALYNASAASFRALGNTKTPLYCSFITNCLNIFGNALGIYVLKMGVTGVALPTLISRILGAVLLFYLFQTGNRNFRIRKISDFHPDMNTVGKIMAIGVPNGIESGVFQFGRLMLSSLVATLGTAAMAGYAVAGNLVNYLYLPGNAMGAALLTIVGQCLGAGDKKGAGDSTKLVLLFDYAMVFGISVIMLAFYRPLLAFYSLSGLSARYASALIMTHIAAMIFWPLSFVTPYYFRASGKPLFTMVVALTTMWIIRVGLAYVFVYLMHKDVLWVWYAMYIDWAVRALIYIIAFKRDRLKWDGTDK